jgi:predicted metal-dependent hydrolase
MSIKVLTMAGEEESHGYEAEERACLQRGWEHFRTGDYFAAHDAWEEVWQGLRGRRRMFWQAMIHLAVGAFHLTNGNRKGCLSQWHKALQKCEALQQMYEAEVPAPLPLLAEALQACLTAVLHDAEPWSYLKAFATPVMSETWFTFK